MTAQHTLAMIKPDGVRKRLVGEIIGRYEKAGLQVATMKMFHMTKREAESFYKVHSDKSFFDSLTDFMSSGPIIALVLRGENAISKNRELMGATNPKEAVEGTIRKAFASDIEKNIVHGSDAPETAEKEIRFFFSDLDILRSNP
ncbi:MAG: nucleoside-diphosphate kinase [Bdellovibrionales bacterium]|nr:nucleoside-diphosphate kinase [Bdellovibrionales bacterium]